MDPTATVFGIDAILKHIIHYCHSISQALHTWTVLQGSPRPTCFDNPLKAIDATKSTLTQLSSLIEIQKDSPAKRLFNDEGLAHANLFARECFIEISRIELAIRKCASHGVHIIDKENADACGGTLTSTDFLETKNADPLLKSFDEKAFLALVERMRYFFIEGDVGRCITRLWALTQTIMLLSQTIGLGNSSDGEKLSIKDTVLYHARISRVATLVCFAPEEDDRSDAGSSDSDTDSDSDCDRNASSRSTSCSRWRSRSGSPREARTSIRLRGSSVSSSRSRSRSSCSFRSRGSSCGSERIVVRHRSLSPRSPPFPPARWPLPVRPSNGCLLPPPPQPMPLYANAGGGMVVAPPRNENGLPPSYMESHRPFLNGACNFLEVVPPTHCPNYSKSGESTISVKEVNERAEEVEDIEKKSNSTLKEGQLLKSKPHTLFYKMQACLRPSSSLAAEVASVLTATDSKLSAYIIQANMLREIPHSAFHTLESTHLRALLSQGHNSCNEWYKTFSTLTRDEHRQLDGVLHQFDAQGILKHREIVVLKVTRKNAANAWLSMLARRWSRGTSIEVPVDVRNHRVILAIMREKISESIPPLPAGTYQYMGAQSPPTPPTLAPKLQVPSLPIFRRPNGPSDLRLPPPPPLNPYYQRHAPREWYAEARDLLQPATAREALTTFNEYRLDVLPAPRAPGFPPPTPSWQRINITQSTIPLPSELQKHITTKLNTHTTNPQPLPPNSDPLLNPSAPPSTQTTVFNTYPVLTPAQDRQLSLLLSQLRVSERSFNFEWNWVHLGMCFAPNSPVDSKGFQNAVSIHAIAARTPRAGVDCVHLYQLACRGPPPPPPPPPPPQSAPRPVMRRPNTRAGCDITIQNAAAIRRRQMRREGEWIKTRVEADIAIPVKRSVLDREGVADALLRLWCGL